MKKSEQSCFLPPQDAAIYRLPTNEPQYVTAIEPMESWVWIDSQNTDGLDNTKSLFHPTGGTVGMAIRRITVKAVGMLWDSPNVNPRNQTVRFYSTATTLWYTVIVPTGNYTTSAALSTALVAAMNTVSGSSGLTFSVVADPLHPDTYTLNCTGFGDFYFDPLCDAVYKGETLWNLPYQDTPVSSCRIGTMFLIYTKYVDIVSRRITSQAKMRSITSNNMANVAVRVYTGGKVFPGDTIVYNPPVDLHFAHRAEDPIYEIDFLWLDQHGDQLYVNDPEKFQWDMNLGFEG